MYGIYFLDASGTVDNVTSTTSSNSKSQIPLSCRRREGPSAPNHRNNSTDRHDHEHQVMDYQKTGFEARGSTMTMNLSGSTAGPPHPLVGFIAQNGVTYVDASGLIANNPEIWGSGDQVPDCCTSGGGNTDGTAILLFGAHGVTVDHNTIVGPGSDRPDLAGTDIGVAVTAGSTDITVSFNQISRSKPDGTADPTGVGVLVDKDPEGPPSSATLMCNTFSGWKTNIVGAIQLGCTPLPDGAECATYSAAAPVIEGGTEPFTWSVSAGSLPPGLTLASDGSITGTPTQVGAFTFTLQVVDSSEPTLTGTADFTVNIAPGCGTHPANHGADVSSASHSCPTGPHGVHGKCVSAEAHSRWRSSRSPSPTRVGLAREQPAGG